MEENNAIDEREILEQQLQSGANWFYWVAGLSIINTLIIYFGSDWSFVIGLGVTQVIDTIILELIKTNANIIALVIEVVIAGLFALLGLFANKGKGWAFILGMVFYTLDALLFFIIEDWLSIGFHAYILFNIFNGFKARNAIVKLGISSPIETVTEV